MLMISLLLGLVAVMAARCCDGERKNDVYYLCNSWCCKNCFTYLLSTLTTNNIKYEYKWEITFTGNLLL